jgi:hypothetical protein
MQQSSAARTDVTTNARPNVSVSALVPFTSSLSQYQVQRTSSAGDVPTAVKNLLLATKELQDALHQWSIGQVSETDVSDVYVRIGTDFNHALHAFAFHNIDMRFVLSTPCSVFHS